jgi:hypothetical protein
MILRSAMNHDYHQCSGVTVTAFSLWWYVTETLSITPLLLDRSRRGVRLLEKILFSGAYPNTFAIHRKPYLEVLT